MAQRRGTPRGKKKPTKVFPLHRKKGVIHIKRKVFLRIQNDPDFIALNRVGRIHNALSESFESLYDAVVVENRSPSLERQLHRSFLNTASFVWEAYKVIDSLVLAYIHEPHFAKFEEIYNDPDKGRKKRLMKAIRHSVGFHLDENSTYTQQALNNLKIPEVPFLSGDEVGLSMTKLYYHLSDIIDLNYIIDEMTQPGESESETLKRIQWELMNLTRDILVGGDQFIRGVAIKLGLFRVG